MPEEKKKKVDLEGLSSYLRKGLITVGLVIIGGPYLFRWIGLAVVADYIIPFAAIVGGLVLLINAQRYDHNKPNRASSQELTIGLAVALIMGVAAYSFMPTKVIVEKDTVRFTGMYGFEMKSSDIANVELADTIPEIAVRANGLSIGGISKGHFKLEQYGKCRLFMHSSRGPYLIITDKSGERTLICYKDSSVTKAYYGMVKKMIGR